MIRRWAATAACLCLVLAGLNLSPALASAAANVPVLGGLFRVLTFVEFDDSEDGIHYNVAAPEVDADSDLAKKVNAAIQGKVDQHLAKAQQDWDDYREAFFATGGTEEQWGDREMDVIIDYEIKSQTGDRVSFVVTFAEGWVSSYEERSCYNLDFVQNRDLTLRDFLGEGVTLVSSGREAALAAGDTLREEGLLSGRQTGGSCRYFVTDSAGTVLWQKSYHL